MANDKYHQFTLYAVRLLCICNKEQRVVRIQDKLQDIQHNAIAGKELGDRQENIDLIIGNY